MLYYKIPLSSIYLFYILLSALQFIVVKFLSTPDDNNVYYEIALAKWLVQIDDNMIGKLLWPNNKSAAGKLVRSETKADETWQQFEVEVKRYYETYCAARNTVKGFEKFSSAYESESGCQMGRGKRKKRLFNPFSSDDDSSDSENKKYKQDKKSKIPAAPLPPPPLAGISSLTKSLSTTSKKNITELTITPNMKQGKRATASLVVTAASTKRTKFLQQVINHRQQAAEKALQRKKAMSLENIYKLSVKKKAIDSKSCCKVPLKVSKSSGNYKSTLQFSSPLNSQSVVEQSLSDTSENSNKASQFSSLLYSQSVAQSLSETSENSNKDRKDSEPHEISGALLKTISNMRAKLDMILINQSKMNRIFMPEEKVLSKPSNMPALPLNTMEQVKMFEKFLSNDVNLSDTCYYLKSLPLGNDETRAVCRLMSHLVSNSLAEKFNFDGHGQKFAFKSTKLWELVQG
ncbi:hypothetical protein ALC62_00768 [Cyphomyrmex costatus]|uniref:DUF4806 domain-containing protein n=1 Tax=Cyphomyrmex costatus TaxID=456900 RepID=A0A151IQ30_9HYME|nr:hypothetical protein ALC62_00768 [Cyphomyrmex costatus]